VNPVKFVKSHKFTAHSLDVLLKSPGSSMEEILASSPNAKILHAQMAGLLISLETSFK
jgi:hypothetical protein